MLEPFGRIQITKPQLARIHYLWITIHPKILPSKVRAENVIFWLCRYKHHIFYVLVWKRCARWSLNFLCGHLNWTVSLFAHCPLNIGRFFFATHDFSGKPLTQEQRSDLGSSSLSIILYSPIAFSQASAMCSSWATFSRALYPGTLHQVLFMFLIT